MGKKIRIAVAGAGNRARHVVNNLLKTADGAVEIGAVYDPDRAVAEEAAVQVWNSPGAAICSSWEQALQCNIGWAMVFSPNYAHKEEILAAFAADKDVFSEKPLATRIEDCQTIYSEWKKSGRFFATGFVLRYSRIYRKAYELLRSGIFGKLVSVEANENITPQHGGYIMSNWRRLTEYAGPHILEKCCHDLDLLEWLTGSLPSKVCAFHGRSFFTPENRPLEEKYGKEAFVCWWDPHRVETPFNAESDLHDNMISIARFRNGVHVSFNYSMLSTLPERRMVFHCTEGTMRLDLYQKKLSWKTVGADEITTLDFSDCDGHGGGDNFIMKELLETMTAGVPPKCSGEEGLLSAVYALALNQSAVTGKIFDLEPVWSSLDRAE